MIFHIVGASRCRTTSLANWLNLSDEVKFPESKEGLHQSTSDSSIKYGTANARMFMHNGIEQVLDKEAKLIFLVRNPVDRAYSHWYHFRSRLPHYEVDRFHVAIKKNYERYLTEGILFNEMLNITLKDITSPDNLEKMYIKSYLETGLYCQQMEKFKSFTKLVLSVDTLNLEETKNIICDFLAIPFINKPFSKVNDNRRINEIDTHSKLFLEEFYEDDLELFNKEYNVEVPLL